MANVQCLEGNLLLKLDHIKKMLLYIKPEDNVYTKIMEYCNEIDKFSTIKKQVVELCKEKIKDEKIFTKGVIEGDIESDKYLDIEYIYGLKKISAQHLIDYLTSNQENIIQTNITYKCIDERYLIENAHMRILYKLIIDAEEEGMK